MRRIVPRPIFWGQRNLYRVLWFWLYIMLIIRHVPEVVFKRLRM